MKHIAVLDYGSGNIASVSRALARIGAEVSVTADFAEALAADGLVVPGVGAFGTCMAQLRAVRGDRLIGRRLAGGRAVLGICVGMQVLFDRGLENAIAADVARADEGVPVVFARAGADPALEDAPGITGLGEWPGTVERLRAALLPHMGWNTVVAGDGSALFAGIDTDARFYFVHSYAVRRWELLADPEHPSPLTPPIVTWTEHGGDDFVAAVENGALSATQFHPEKSGDVGAQLLANWLATV